MLLGLSCVYQYQVPALLFYLRDSINTINCKHFFYKIFYISHYYYYIASTFLHTVRTPPSNPLSSHPESLLIFWQQKTCLVFLAVHLGPGAASPQGTRVPERPSVLDTGVTARLNSLVISVFGGGESLKF